MTTTFSTRKKLGLIILFYLCFHSICLTRLPIFNDESIYLDWGWRSLHSKGHAFYAANDAKPPLAIWLFGLSHTFLPSNPLLFGRFLSVLMGLITLIGLYKLSQLVSQKPTPLLTTLIYTLTPLFVFYNRQVLLEAPLAAALIWTIYWVVRLYRQPTIAHLFLLTLMFIVACFIKFTALVLIASIMVSATIVYLHKRNRPHLEYLLMVSTASVSSLLLLLPLYLQTPMRQNFSTLNRYLVNPHTGIFMSSVHNLMALWQVSLWHLTLPILIAALFGYIKYFRKSPLVNLNLIIAISLILLLLLAGNLNPRYLVPFLPLLPLYAGLALTPLLKTTKKRIVLILILCYPLLVSLIQIIAPTHLFALYQKFTPHSYHSEYITSWNSGYGIPETLKFLKDKAQRTPIIVGVRVDAGNPESAMHAYLVTNPRIKIVYLDAAYMSQELSQRDCLKLPFPTYFVSRDYHLAGLDRFLTEVVRFQKPLNQNSIGVYQVKTCPQ